MARNANYISSSSLFNLNVSGESWREVEEYKDEYAIVIALRESYRMAFAHRSPQIAYREYLVNHLKEVAIARELTHCTLHLAVYTMDIFMDHHAINTDRLLLVANCCLLIAAKIEECNSKTPKIAELNTHIPQPYVQLDYKMLEAHILCFFEWNVMFPTAAHYVHYYLQAAVTNEDVIVAKRRAPSIIREMHLTIRSYLDKIIDDIHYMQLYRPSMLAAAVIAIARIVHGLDEWNEKLENFTRYSQADIVATKFALLESLPLLCNECSTEIN